jgi:hypothetical protein
MTSPCLILVMLMATLDGHASTKPTVAELAAITARGRMLVEYDAAAWQATDAVMATHPKSEPSGRYIARQTEAGWVVDFGRLNGAGDKFLVDYEASQEGTKFLVKSFDPEREDVGWNLAAAKGMETVTAEVKKAKYVYYHCTGYKGKCGLPYMKEEVLGKQLGDVLKNIYVPDPVLMNVVASIRSADGNSAAERRQATLSVERRLTALRARMKQAYFDKLDGNIAAEFWSRMQQDWQQEKMQLEQTLTNLQQPVEPQRLLDAERALELANKAHSLYEMQNRVDQGKLLKMVLSNCSTDGVTLWPVYRKPFDLIFNRVKTEEWCAREDSNF